MRVEDVVLDLTDWAAEGALGYHDAAAKRDKILAGIDKLRERIDELGGYHDDV